jgi:hypothetical protein
MVAALSAAAALVVCGACGGGSSSAPSTPTAAPSPTADNSAYLREASRLIDVTNRAIDDVNELIDRKTYDSISLYGVAFGVYAEQWRENEPPESYRSRHDVVQRSLDRLERVGSQAAGGRVNVTEMILAGSTFKSAAEDFKKPAQ